MKTLKDLKESLKEQGVEEYQIESAGTDAFQITFRTKRIFGTPIGFDVVTFTTIGTSTVDEVCISFTVKF